jgi:hypothetical protein
MAFNDTDETDTMFSEGEGKSLFEMESWNEDVTNPEGDEPEKKEPEAGTTGQEGEAEPEGKTDGQEDKPEYYTVEELRELDPDDLDTTKIPPELQPIYKSFQKGYTKKFQSLADERKRLEEERSRAAQPPQQQGAEPTDIYSVYARDPRKVEQAINDEILKLEDTDPLGDDYRPARKRIRELENLRDDLRDKHRQHEEKKRSVDSLTERVVTEIRKIPDFDKRKDALEEIAIGYGMTKQDLALITNPHVTGEVSAKVVKLLNAIYEERSANVKGNLKKKEVKPDPTKVEGAGGGKQEKDPADGDKWTEKDYFAMRTKTNSL